ncbi:TPA: hypothetical protein ACJMD7_001965, partial [Neisseria meningitidis]
VIPAQAGIQAFGRRQYSKIIRKFEVLDSRFHGNDGMLRESWEWRNVSVITGMAKFQTALQVSEPM